jgi:xylulokinase
MGDLVVGVDLGSGSARALALDRDGAVRAAATARYPRADCPPGRADPTGWLAALERVVAALGVARPAALAVGGQSPTTVPGSGGLAVTCTHPAGATLDPPAQHAAQHALLRAEGASDPMQLWDFVLARLGAPPAQGRWPGDPALDGFGPVVPTGTACGASDGSLGVPAGTPLVPGAQDAYLAFWAAGVDEPGRALDPGGRTGGLGVAVAAGARPAGLFALPAAAAGVDVVGGPVSAHGLALEWWSAMTGRGVEALLDAAAGVAPGAGGVVALPYLEGERAPRWDRDLRAELVGLSAATGPAEVMRALLEGAAYGLRHIATELASHGVTMHTLVVGGSPARSPLWCAIKADVLEVPVEVPEQPELAAYGAALAAGAAIGWWPQPGAGRAGDWPRPRCATVAPRPRPEYRAGYRRFVELGDEAVRRLARERSLPMSEEDPCRTR